MQHFGKVSSWQREKKSYNIFTWFSKNVVPQIVMLGKRSVFAGTTQGLAVCVYVLSVDSRTLRY